MTWWGSLIAVQYKWTWPYALWAQPDVGFVSLSWEKIIKIKTMYNVNLDTINNLFNFDECIVLL